MSPLHHVGEFLRELLLAIPMPVVRALFLAVPLILLAWVLLLPRKQVTAPDGEAGRGGNLRIWAVLALALQVLVYSIL